jgi:pteridine reductase
MKCNGKNAALVTGGARRIGAAIAVELAKSGYDIALHYNTSVKEARETQKLIKSYGRDCSLFGGDLKNSTFTNELVTAAYSAFPHLNVLINCASVFKRAGIADTTSDLFDELTAVNLKAPFILTKEFARLCGRGNIINILDTKVSQVQNVYSAYIISRAGLLDITRLSAAEFAPQIRCNAICPGLVLQAESEDSDYIKRLESRNLLGRTGSAVNITSTVKFLLDNDFITGEVIYVDGGEKIKQGSGIR